MYAKYQTEALVLGSYSRGEADRVFTLFTRDFGLVRARASAVRSESSRMRYALQHFSRAHVSLVRGTRGWRASGASALFDIREATKEGAGAFARIAQLTERLVGGEEANERLFSILIEAHTALSGRTSDAWATIELVCVARILHVLGYLAPEALHTALFATAVYEPEALAQAEQEKTKLLSSVNRALSETHL